MADQDFNRKIGLKIKMARTHAGMTQKELADKVDAKRTTITNVERGTQGVPIELLISICEETKTDIADILRMDIDICPTCGQFVGI